MKIGIIGAMEEEINEIINKIENKKHEKVAFLDVYIGEIYEHEVYVARSSEGKVNAAVCTQAMILKYDLDMILNVGVAGAISDKLQIGGIAISSSTVEFDQDTTALGYDAGFTFGINKVYVDCNKNICDKIYNIAKEDYNTEVGVIASSDKFVSDEDTKDYIKNNFDGVIAVDMETASISHVCYLNNVPFCAIRAISDSTKAVQYKEFVNFATKNLYDVLMLFLQNI